MYRPKEGRHMGESRWEKVASVALLGVLALVMVRYVADVFDELDERYRAR